MSSRTRIALFALLAAGCVGGVALAIANAVGGSGEPRGPTGALLEARDDGRPVIIFRNLDRRQPQTFGQLAVAGLPPQEPRTLLPLRCERVYFEAGTGLCLTRGRAFAAGYRARVFGADLRPRGEVALEGVPSRVRVSPDGRYGATTLFVSGHSYADLGGFSTTTTIIDLVRGRKVAELEDFRTFRAGRRVTAVDANYWGVTFRRDGDRFYATLSTGGRIHLVEGSVSRRTMHTIGDDVECPSLSPDGTRLAYKKRVGAARKRWRIHVLELATMRETALAEPRNVDDQVEWLDDATVLYGLDEEIWALAADGAERPRRYARRGDSPAVVRW